MTTHICSPEVTSWLDFFFWYLKWWTRKILIKFDIKWRKFYIIFQKQSHSFWFEVTAHSNFFYNVTVARKINSYCTYVKMTSVNVMQCLCISFTTCTFNMHIFRCQFMHFENSVEPYCQICFNLCLIFLELILPAGHLQS